MKLINDEQSDIAHFCARLGVPPPAQHVPVLRSADHYVAALEQCIVRDVFPLHQGESEAINKVSMYCRVVDALLLHMLQSALLSCVHVQAALGPLHGTVLDARTGSHCICLEGVAHILQLLSSGLPAGCTVWVPGSRP